MTEVNAQRLRPKYRKLLSKYRGAVWFLAVALVVLLFFQTIVSAMAALMLIVVGSFSTIWRRLIRFNLGFELITPIFVIFAFAYNPIIAFVAAAFMTVAAAVVSNTVGPTTFGRIGCLGLLTVFAFMMLSLPVLQAGIMLVVLLQVMLVFLYGFTYGFKFFASAFPVAVNITTNYIFLSTFAAGLVAVL